MTAKELILELSKLPPEAKIFVADEQGETQPVYALAIEENEQSAIICDKEMAMAFKG